VSARGGGLGQSSSEGRRHLGDGGGDVVGLASAQGGAQGALGLGLSERQRPLERKRDRETEIDLPLSMPT
jgi:hypothetical protein